MGVPAHFLIFSKFDWEFFQSNFYRIISVFGGKSIIESNLKLNVT